MDTQRPQFDSHRFVKRLMTAGLSEEVAEILADEHTRLIVPEDVATKTDVGVVQAEMATRADLDKVDAKVDGVKAEMATRADLDKVDAKVDGVKADVAKVDAKVDRVKAEMATKADLHREIAACEARMEQRLQNAILEAKVSLIKWMIATMAVFSGIVIGAMTALQ